MIGRLLKWIGFDQSRTSHSSNRRSTHSSGRRLAFESVEHRVLLSANATEPVAEGGTVYMMLDGGTLGTTLEPGALSGRILHETWQSDRGNYYGQGYSTVNVVRNQRSGDVATLEQPDDALTNLDVILVKPAGSSDVLTTSEYEVSTRKEHDQEGTYSVTAPKSEELVPTDIAPIDLRVPVANHGLVDVSYIARREVSRNISATIEGLDSDAPPGTALEIQLAGVNASAVDSSVQTVAYKPAKSLSGSRSRLAAFDLAMRDNASIRHAHLDHAAPSDHAVDAPAPAVETSSPRQDSAQAPTLSSLSDNTRRPLSELEIAAHDLALADFAMSADDSPDLLETTLISRSARPNTRNVQDKPDTNQLAGNRAVYLDQRREYHVAHLVAVAGVGHALLGHQNEPAREVQHEQLPPRKRQPGHPVRV